MTTEAQIRDKIKQIYEKNPVVHIDVSFSRRPRLFLKNVEVKITAVYSHIFQIEECSTGEFKKHTVQYADVLIGTIKILELEDPKE